MSAGLARTTLLPVSKTGLHKESRLSLPSIEDLLLTHKIIAAEKHVAIAVTPYQAILYY